MRAAKHKVRKKNRKTWVVLGFDVSMSVMAGGAMGYDKTLRKTRGPVTADVRWPMHEDYWNRLAAAASSHNLVHELIGALGMAPKEDEIFLAVEEPWAFGHATKGESAWMKQQAQISGAFLGGLARYGYKNVQEINNMLWRTHVAKGLGITTHYSKWNNPKGEGKLRARQWVERVHPEWDEEFPDLVRNAKQGLIPRPDTSKAKPVQCDDRYVALAVMDWLKGDLRLA